MKTNLMKKAVAVTLSVAMACSASMIASPTTASAAAKVGVKTTFKTLQVGSKHTLRIVNGSGWKITKAASTDKTIANSYFISKSKGYVKVKGKSEGKAAIKVTLKNTKTKKKATAKCLYKVVPVPTTPTPDTPTPDTPAVETEATVDTQEKLDAALANKDLKKITIKTSEEATFTIKEGEYKNIDLIVDAPKSDVTNNGVFNSITINAIKNNTYTENAKGNRLVVAATTACNIVIGENAEVTGISFTTVNASVTLVANGKVGKVTISANVTIAISGKVTVPVEITKDATGTKLTASTPVTVETAAANTNITIEKGAEASTIKVTANDAPITVDNKTDKAITVTKNDNTTQTVNANSSSGVAATTGTQTTTPGTTTTPSTSTTKTDTKDVVMTTGSSFKIDNAKVTPVKITSGDAIIITTSSITVEFEGVESTSGAAVEYMAEYKDATGAKKTMNWTTATSYGTNNSMHKGTVSINAQGVGSVDVKLYFRIKSTATTNAGTASSPITFSINVVPTETETGWIATIGSSTTPEE